MFHFKIKKTVRIPNKPKLRRFKKLPELGPNILFFSGGSALRDLSQKLIHYTHNSVHLITPFDSGGSSAEIRKHFSMPAVGDLRNRLMALSDHSFLKKPQIYELFSYRFPDDWDHQSLVRLLRELVSGHHSLIKSVSSPFRNIICSHLHYFYKNMPPDFDLRGANIGNLIIAGGYLNQNRQLEPVLYLFEKLVNVKGTVRPVLEGDYHLVAELEDSSEVIGQKDLTGKETSRIKSKVKKLRLVATLEKLEEAHPKISDVIQQQIEDAETICFTYGSFYSSLIANLLPAGVAAGVANNHGLKVFIPSLGYDPEALNMSLSEQVLKIQQYLNLKLESPREANDFIDIIIVDTKSGKYGIDIDLEKIRDLGIHVIDTNLTSNDPEKFSPDLLNEVLFSIT